MGPITSYRDLEVWQVSLRLVLSIALGSQAELETYIEISRRLKLLSDPQLAATDALVQSVGRLLHGLRNSIERRNV